MESNTLILIVDADGDFCDRLAGELHSCGGFSVITAATGAEAQTAISRRSPDIALFELLLPDAEGIDVIRGIRTWSKMPIIALTTVDEEGEKVRAFEAGVDDYVVKPCGKAELAARIGNALRHSESLAQAAQQSTRTVVGGIVIDHEKGAVTVDGEPVSLTQIEYRILALICKYAGRVLTYDYIVERVWGAGSNKGNQLLRVNIANIRKKIEKNPAEPHYILTETGIGYQMRQE